MPKEQVYCVRMIHYVKLDVVARTPAEALKLSEQVPEDEEVWDGCELDYVADESGKIVIEG